MDRRTKNVEIFKDSVELMNGSSRLQQAIKESVNKQKLYLEAEEIVVPDSKGNLMNPFAGNAPADIEEDGLYGLHLQRLERVFRVAAANGAEVLILGAFGCGAFCNPPAVVARAFKKIQEKFASYFETIEYAVFCGGHETQNYDAFCEVLGAKEI